MGEGEVVGGSAMTPLERAMMVSYRLSIVTVALYIYYEIVQRTDKKTIKKTRLLCA